MNKTETIVLILILVVAFAGVWFLYSGPGLAIQPIIRSEGFTEQVGDVLISVPPSMPAAQPGNLCVCKNAATGQIQSRPAGSGESIYSCRSSCVSQGLQFVALQQPGSSSASAPTVAAYPAASATITTSPVVGIKKWWDCECKSGKTTRVQAFDEFNAKVECAKKCDPNWSFDDWKASGFAPEMPAPVRGVSIRG